MESIQESILVLILESESSIPVDSGIDTGIEVFWTSLVVSISINYTIFQLHPFISNNCRAKIVRKGVVLTMRRKGKVVASLKKWLSVTSPKNLGTEVLSVQ